MNAIKSLFKGMSWEEVGIVICIAILLVFVIGFVLLAIVYILPIPDNIKPFILMGLGVVSVSVGYFVLMMTPAINHEAKPAPSTPNTACQEFWRGVKSIKRIFVHSPTIPKSPTTNSNTPKPMNSKTTKAFILSSICSYLKKVLHRVL